MQDSTKRKVEKPPVLETGSMTTFDDLIRERTMANDQIRQPDSQIVESPV
jgi:hypothetical protein